MMELTLKIEANELTQAILKLASAIEGASGVLATKTAETVQAPVTPATPPVVNAQPPIAMPTAIPTQNAYTVPTAPVTPPQPPIQQASVSAPTSAPIVQPVPTPTAPTSVPSYTIEQLQTAIAPLLDAGKVQQIQALVQSFGVATLMEIPQERYGEFANGLRNLGGVL